MDLTKNSDDFWTWVSSNKQVTPITTAQRLVLAEQDKLCQNCLLQDINRLLCPGTRTVFSLEESDSRHAATLVAARCSKAHREQEVAERSELWDRTFLWPDTLAQYLADFANKTQRGYLQSVIVMQGLDWTIDGACPPRFSRIDGTVVHAKAAQELVVAHAKAGIVASYINVNDFFLAHSERDQGEFWASNKNLPWYYRRGNSLTTNITRLTGAAWLVLTGFPKTPNKIVKTTETMLSYVVERIAPIVEYRLERNLPTTVALSESEIPFVADKLKPLVSEIATWNPLF